MSKKFTEVNERTAELYSKRGKTGITELVVIDETTRNAEKCERHNAKGKSFCTCGDILQELSVEKIELLGNTTAQVLIRLCGLQWRAPRSSPQQSIISGRHKRKNSKVVQIDGEKDADCRECTQEKRTARTRTQLGQSRKCTTLGKSHNLTPQQRQAHFGNQWCCSNYNW